MSELPSERGMYHGLKRGAEVTPLPPVLSDAQCEAIARVYCAARFEYLSANQRRGPRFSELSQHGREYLYAAIRRAWSGERLRAIAAGEQIVDWRETALLHNITRALTAVPEAA